MQLPNICAAKIEEPSKDIADMNPLKSFVFGKMRICSAFARGFKRARRRGEQQTRAGRHSSIYYAGTQLRATLPCFASRLRVPFAMWCRLPACSSSGVRSRYAAIFKFGDSLVDASDDCTHRLFAFQRTSSTPSARAYLDFFV